MSEIYTPPKIAGDDGQPTGDEVILRGTAMTPAGFQTGQGEEAVDERAALLEVDAGFTPEQAAAQAMAETPAKAIQDLEIGNRFLNQWRDSLGRSTDAPGPLVLFAGVGLLSALCHRYFFYAPRETYLNLFLFILGPSSSARKTTVLDMVRDYLAEIEPDLILPDTFTPEALFTCLTRKNHGTVFSRELNAWLDQMLGPDYNRGLASTLGNLYDHMKNVSRETKKDGLQIIEDPVVTILGAGVDEYLIDRLKDPDMVSGFWPRVTLVRLPPQIGKAYRSPGRFMTEPHILDKLRAIAAQPGGEISFEKINPLREIYAGQLYGEAAGINNANLAAGYARLEWILVKIAAILEIVDNPTSTEIGPAAFKDAVTLVDYIKRQLPEFYGEHLKPDQEAKLATWALDFIEKRDEGGTAWVPYRTILQHSHAATAKLGAALKRLLATEECEQAPIPATKQGGRPGEAYRRARS